MNIVSKKNLYTVGETTNLMSIDSQKFMDASLYLNYTWSAPLQVSQTPISLVIFFITKLDVILKIALSMYFLWDILGPSSLAGLAVMVLMIPANTWIGKKMKYYQFTQMRIKDRRTRFLAHKYYYYYFLKK